MHTLYAVADEQAAIPRPRSEFWRDPRLWNIRPSERPGVDIEAVREFARRAVDANYAARPAPERRLPRRRASA
jgi:hypothetical protein